jgi:hypothetical protein
LSESQAGQLNRLLHYHITHQISKPLRSGRYILPRGAV